MTDQPDKPEPPEQDPDATGGPVPPPAQGGYGQPTPSAGANPYGEPTYGQPPQPGQPGAPGQFAAPTKTNGLAIGSLVASLVGLLCGIGAIIGIVLGFIALNQIKQRGEGGKNLAIAGIAVGAIAIILSVILFATTA